MADTPTPNPLPTPPPQVPVPPVPPQVPVPPVPVPPMPVPLVPTQAQAQPQPQPVQPREDLTQSFERSSSPLSPFNLLAKKQAQTTQVVPPPTVTQAQVEPVSLAIPQQPQVPQAQSVPLMPIPKPNMQVAPQPSREELLQQAAEAPAASFILPPPEVIATQIPQAPLTAFQTIAPPPKPPQPLPLPPTPRVVPQVLGTPAAPLAGQQKQFVAPQKVATTAVPREMGAPLPQAGIVRRIPGRITPSIQDSLNSVGASGGLVPKKAKRKLVGIFLIVAAISLILGVGAAYIMAKNGTRVPILFKQISGLEPKGLESTKQVLAYVEARTSYQVQGEIELVDVDFLDASGKPKLLVPGEVEAGKVYRLKAQIGQGEMREKGTKVMSTTALTVNQNDPLPVALRQGGGAVKTDLNAYFSASTNPEVTVFSGDLLDKTLLSPVFKPIPLEKLLAIPTGELAYQKQTGGKANTIVSAHSFTVSVDMLQPYFPKEATLENFTVIHRYAWKQASIPAAQPSASELKGTITYKQKKYAYTASLRYGSWDKPLETSEDSSGSLAKLTATTAPKEISIASVVAQAGILNLDSLPNTLTDEEKLSSPTPPTTPIVIPPASTAITPSGEGITAPGTKILGDPVVPAIPASAEAKARDVQRAKDLADLKKALMNYKEVKGVFPVSLARIQTIEGGVLLSELVDTYLTKLPIDPTKSIYWYEYSSDGSRFTLRAVAEDPQTATVIKGLTYSYFEVTN